MSTYLHVISMQRPFPFNVDENNRTMFSVNFQAKAWAPVNQLEEEIGTLLVAAGAVPSPDVLLFGPLADVPDGDGPFVTIIDTGGMAPEETHDGGKYENLSFQVIIRAADHEAGRTTALAVWRALDGVRNRIVLPT